MYVNLEDERNKFTVKLFKLLCIMCRPKKTCYLALQTVHPRSKTYTWHHANLFLQTNNWLQFLYHIVGITDTTECQNLYQSHLKVGWIVLDLVFTHGIFVAPEINMLMIGIFNVHAIEQP